MNRFHSTKAHAILRGAVRDQVRAPLGVIGEPIRVVGG